MRLFGLWLSLMSTGGCTILVSGEEVQYCAVVDGGDPCPDGTKCTSGICTACVVANEICDGVDNDCDTEIDEGHDDDDDGTTWCGGGRQEERDCDDNDPSAHPAVGAIPAGVEQCDGRDDDCDGSADEEPRAGEPPLCEDAQECLSTEGCVVPDCTTPGHECPTDEQCDVTVDPPVCAPGRCTKGSCPDGEECDVQTGACFELLPIGSPCTVHGQCESDNCVSLVSLRLEEEGGPRDRICGLACCSDADCDVDQICWASGSGARSCIPASLVHTSRGSSPAFAECSANEECNSGICDDVCIAPCARDENCGSDQVCGLGLDATFGTLTDWSVLMCGPPVGVGEIGEPCAFRDDCQSGLCVGGEEQGQCTQACGSASDCPSAFYCGAAYSETTAAREFDYIPVCFPKNHEGNGMTGAACLMHGDCRDFRCENERCADACCSQADCPTGSVCRPVIADEDGRWQMHCL